MPCIIPVFQNLLLPWAAGHHRLTGCFQILLHEFLHGNIKPLGRTDEHEKKMDVHSGVHAKTSRISVHQLTICC